MSKQYLDLGFTAEYVSGEAVVKEVDKLESWGWYDLSNLPKPLFGCQEKYLLSYLTSQTYFDS